MNLLQCPLALGPVSVDRQPRNRQFHERAFHPPQDTFRPPSWCLRMGRGGESVHGLFRSVDMGS